MPDMSKVNYARARASVQCLPPELLSRIFIMGKDDEELEALDYPDRQYSYRPTHCQDTYAQVSTCFRTVALGVASLWATLTVNSSASLDQVQTYCTRSSTAPLAIHVDIGPNVTNEMASAVLEMLGFVVNQSHRWRELIITVAEDVVAQRSVVQLLCSCVAPVLEHLTLAIDAVDTLDTAVARASPTHPTIFTQGLLNISFLRLRGLAIHIFRPPLGCLTILHLDQTNTITITYAAFKELIMASTNLAHLSVYGETLAQGDWPAFSSQSTDIQLPSLQSLRIRGIDGSVFAGILMNIAAPVLRSLTLKEMQEDDLITRLQLPSPLPVQEITFCDFDLSEKGYRHLFRIFPHVEAIYLLSSTIGTSKIFKELCNRAVPDGLFCPPQPWERLRTVNICFDDRDDYFLIPEFLHDREKLGYPLAAIRFITSEEGVVSDWLEEELQDTIVTTIPELGKWPFSPNTHFLDCNDTLFD